VIVYKVTNRENGMSYIGQTTKSLEARKEAHAKVAGCSGYYFHRALRKYGIDSFEWEIIKRCKSHDELTRSEQLFIKQFNSRIPNGYNMTDGGEGLLNPTEEVRRKISIACTGKVLTDEHKKKLSESIRG